LGILIIYTIITHRLILALNTLTNSINIMQTTRRKALKTSALVFMGLALPRGLSAENRKEFIPNRKKIPEHFPNIDPQIIGEVVGKSHFDLDRVKELVEARPELSRSVWEWRFGDFESAIGAASHVGRRDIALYLLEKGARPTIFTFAMLGAHDTIKSLIEAYPGIQKSSGPHGFSLLDHAYAGKRMKDKMSVAEVDNVSRTIDYLEAIGDASGQTYLEVSAEEQKKYLGDYWYGDSEAEGFTIKNNMRNMLSLGPIGGFGGGLYKIAENKFTYNGAPSVNISFEVIDNIVKSLTLKDPTVTLVAKKVS